MNTEQLRDYAKRMYSEHFKPNQCEDEWYYEGDYWINIFHWEGSPATVNIYEGPDADHLELIDDLILED